MTRNVADFQELHRLHLEKGGHHPGLLFRYFDNNPRKDLSPAGVVAAIDRLVASGLPFEDECHNLNHWKESL